MGREYDAGMVMAGQETHKNGGALLTMVSLNGKRKATDSQVNQAEHKG